jgi:hypothetical protein
MDFFKIFLIYFRVTFLTDIEKISDDTSCTKAFIKKGKDIASFIYARCIHLGKAVKKNEQIASNYYKLVKFFNTVISSLYSLV